MTAGRLSTPRANSLLLGREAGQAVPCCHRHSKLF